MKYIDYIILNYICFLQPCTPDQVYNLGREVFEENGILRPDVEKSMKKLSEDRHLWRNEEREFILTPTGLRRTKEVSEERERDKVRFFYLNENRRK